MVAFLLLPLPLPAFSEDLFTASGGVSTLHDSNLYRTEENTEKDQIVSSFIAVQADKTVSRQRFVLDAKLTDNRFNNNDHLDYRGASANADWLWSFTSRLKGELGMNYSEAINSFVDYTGSEKNIRTQKRYYFNADWNVLGRWWLSGGGSHFRQENSALFRLEADYRSDSLDVGVKYRVPSGNYLELLARHTEGVYANRVADPRFQIDSGFDQKEAELRYLWQVTGKTRLSGHVGYLTREHNNYFERDYDGAVGSLVIDYLIGGSVRLNATLQQDLASYQSSPINDITLFFQDSGYFNSSYYQRQVAAIGPVWQYSSKINFQIRYRHEERSYDGGLISGLPEREDVLESIMLVGEWTPRDYLQIMFHLHEETRDSNRNDADFTSEMAGLSLALVF